MKNKYRNTDSSIKAGDLILTEQPFAYVLSSKEKGFRCDNCLEKGKVLKCSGCQFVHYCGRSCQRDAWNDHKWECSNLKRIAPKVIPDGARMLAKIINRLKRSDGNSYRAFYSATSFRMWKDLMSHYSDLKADKKRMDHFTSLCVVLYEFLKDISLPNTVELMGIYGRMVINSFTLLDTDMNSIGTGIYLACSIVDHSCNPNAVATFDGKTISIRAIQDMPCLDWNQIRISYIDLMKSPYDRQTELLKSYYFLCQCDRCMDENQHKVLHGAKCLNRECDNPVKIPWKENCELVRKPEKSDDESEPAQNGDALNDHDELEIKQNGLEQVIHCTECGTKYTENHVNVFIKTMEFTEMHLQNMQETSVAYVDVCKYCLERQEGVLHHLNVMHAQTLDHAFDALIQVQLWELACEYAEKLIPCFKFYYGDRHPLLGLLHLKYGKILLYKTDLQKALAQLKCSQKILKMTHGERHPLYKDQLLPLLTQAMLENS
ncbi:histone-lysine N-methyltransferase SMYD3 isoform X1 [Pectinophora gossypiella]|uniref:histone-lysine N-methyltransferase SMYD3 isoform X1 n=2 Tax=Pectinophora gossypiella TaxID=13191 RepID=UPI00214EEE66|nr:histone-lysine N-methyltransferase SMYD3 isoform X1 [Pectinophora gossypiella]